MKLKKIKNALLVTLSLALVAAASVAITYALGSSKDFGGATNEFKNDNITASLTEVHWDGTSGNPSGNSTSSTADPTSVASASQGQEIAKNYLMGQVIPKDPKVNNTSDRDIPVYVGIKAVYTATIKDADNSNADVNATYYTKAQFEDAIAKFCKAESGTEGLNDGWSANADGTHFYYANQVAKGYASAPLFTHVKINTFAAGDGATYKIKTFSSAADTTGTYVNTNELPTFNINLTGYAISAEGNATLTSAATTALDNLMA